MPLHGLQAKGELKTTKLGIPKIFFWPVRHRSGIVGSNAGPGRSVDARRGARPPREVVAMSMTFSVVSCSMSDCAEPATYKVAAPWSDGSFSELKTFGFAC